MRQIWAGLRSPNRTIRQRLMVGNFVLGLLLLLAGLIVIWQVNRLATAVASLQQASARVTTALEVRQDSTYLIAIVSQLLPTEDAILFENDVAGALNTLRNSYEDLSALAMTENADTDLAAVMNQSLTSLNSVIGIAEAMVRQAQAAQWPDVRLQAGALNRDQQQLLADTNALITQARRMEEAAIRQVAAARHATIIYPGLVIFLVILFGYLLTWGTLDSIARPVEHLTAGAERLSAGVMSERIVVERADELGQLAETFNRMADRLRAFQEELEQRVEARTLELAERIEQLNLINRVARETSMFVPLDDLLIQVAQLIRQSSGYYAVLIGLVDHDTNELYLRTGSTADHVSPSLNSELRMSLTEDCLVCFAVRERRPFIAADVSTHPIYMPLAILPDTRSELALPLAIGSQVLGVLDLQSDQVHAFAAGQVQVLQTLADQIAIAIRNKQLFQDTQAARAEAEEANRLKSQFLANMSHELRTPLNSIINFAYLLVLGTEGTLSPGQEDMLKRIGDAGHHLLGLINDILDLAKIEAGRLEVFFQEVDAGQLIQSVMATAVGLLRDKPVALRQEIPPDLPPVYADAIRVRQVLLNLLSNAAKFTETGEIVIQAQADEQWVTIRVADTGIGLSPEDMRRVFSEFVQGESSVSRRIGGTGLGLSISKQLVELHGGRIWAASQPGEGATFSFTLPVLKPELPATGGAQDA
ncbi:MAG: GAF domain-containing protein [Ardenticatenaceae bacterium]|nr:GAF domain-containing protein [Ardenticatenaceae bacterium]